MFLERPGDVADGLPRLLPFPHLFLARLGQPSRATQLRYSRILDLDNTKNLPPAVLRRPVEPAAAPFVSKNECG
jgi:hypothetical protein